jgi:hypothetical protein
VTVKESLNILRSRWASMTWEQENHDLLIMWFLTRCQGILRRQLRRITYHRKSLIVM